MCKEQHFSTVSIRLQKLKKNKTKNRFHMMQFIHFRHIRPKLVEMTHCFERLGTDEDFFAKYGYIIRDLVPDLQDHTMKGLRDHFPVYCGGR